MLKTNLDEQSFKIHLDQNGKVWYVDKDGPIINSEVSWNEFRQKSLYVNVKYIRLVGAIENASIIVQLFDQKRENNTKLKKLEVCSPLVCQNVADRNDPEIALLEMRRWSWPSSLGGFHEVTTYDYYQYLLSIEISKKSYKFSNYTKSLLLNHPAWKSLSFISHLDTDYTAKLLGLIIDPRWYIDFSEPDSGAKLKSYLGLTPKTQGFVSGESGHSHGIHPERCRLVMKVWKTRDKEPVGKDLYHPTCFLWRIWLDHGKAYEADLRTSQAFVAFLRHTWLATLYDSNPNISSESLFVPAYFFKLPEEIAYYNKHINNYEPNSNTTSGQPD